MDKTPLLALSLKHFYAEQQDVRKTTIKTTKQKSDQIAIMHSDFYSIFSVLNTYYKW